MMDINTGKFGEHFTTTQLTSSSLIWFSMSSLEDEFSPHVWRRRRTNLYGWAEGQISAVRVLQKVWPALTLVNAWSNWAEIWWEVRFWKAVLFGTEIEVKGLTNLLLRWLLACCPALTFSGQRWLFGVDLGWLVCWLEDCCDTFWVGWPRRLCWLKHLVDRCNAPPHFSCFWFVFYKIHLYVLSAFCLTICMIAVRKVKLLLA